MTDPDPAPLPPQDDDTPAKPKRDQGERLAWHQVWALVLTNPSEATFDRILDDPQASTRRALGWIFASGFASVMIAVLFIVLRFREVPIQFLFQAFVSALTLGGWLVVRFWLTHLILQFVARRMKGSGTYSELYYACAAFEAPLRIIAALVGSLTANPLFFLALGVYQLLLTVIAVKAVNRFNGWQAVAALVLAGIIGVALSLLVGILLSFWLR